MFKQKSWSLIIFLILSFGIKVYSQIDTVKIRFQKEGIDRVVAESKILDYLSFYKNDGSFLDVDYESTLSTAWPALEHLNRLFDICSVYHKNGSKYYHSVDIKNRIKKMFDFFYTKNPRSANWWYEAIGVPIVIGPALVLMKTGNEYGLDSVDLVQYSKSFLKYYSESISKWPGASTGANKVWLLKGSIYKSVIESNTNNLSSGFQMAFSEVKISTGKTDGIKQDFSFYQHGPQLYCAGYGMSFLSDICYFGTVAVGTTYQLSPAQLSLLSDLTVDGYTCFAQNSAFDFGSAGREISREGALSTASLITIIDRLLALGAPRSSDLIAAKSFLNGTAPYVKLGNHHFWKMDMMVQHQENFYFSVKAPSNRTVGTEWMNGENLKGKYLSWGATNVMHDGTEYRGIFPMWDWTLIPGVTSIKETLTKFPISSGSNLTPLNTFSGGVSNGNIGLMSFEYQGFSDKNGSYNNLTAKKSYFVSPDAIYCFGTGISSTSTLPVVTAVEQCFTKNNAYISDNYRVDIFTQNEKSFQNLNWVFHNKIAYIFPTPQAVTVANKNQSGTWYDINTSGSKTTKTQSIFSTYVNHGTSPSNGSYNYIIAPFNSYSEINRWNNPFVLILNESKKQAVYHKNEKMYGISFFSADSIQLTQDLSLKVNEPCLILLHIDTINSKLKLYVSDPLYTKTQVNIQISLPLVLPNTEVLNPKSSNLVVAMPTGEYKGRTVYQEYSISNITSLKNQPIKKKNITVQKRNEYLLIKDLYPNSVLFFYDVNGNLIHKTVNQLSDNLEFHNSIFKKNKLLLLKVVNSTKCESRKIFLL